MVQQLRILVAHMENLGLIPRTHKVVHSCNSSSKEPDSLFQHPQALTIHAVHIDTHGPITQACNE